MWTFEPKVEFEGDFVKTVHFRWGINRRPLWETFEELKPDLNVKWADRFSAFQAVFAEWAVVKCYESALGLQVSARADYLRCLTAELQRLLWCFNYVYILFDVMGDSVRAQQALRLREHVLSGQEMFTGARVLPQIFCIGGIERDLSLGEARKLRQLLATIEKESHFFFDQLDQDFLLRHRLTGVAPLRKSVCAKLRWGGPVGQASGFNWDARKFRPYGPYRYFEVRTFESPLKTEDGESYSDSLSRLEAVMFQIYQALHLAVMILEKMPEGPILPETRIDVPIPHGVFESVVEGGSGPLMASIGDGRLRLNSASMRVAPYIERMCMGLERDDFDIGFASFGFDFCEGDLV